MSDSQLTLIDLRGRVDDPAVRELISYAVGYPTPEKLDAVMQPYSASERELVGVEQDGAVVACLGYERVSPTRTVIHHIAVALNERRGGLGRALVEWLQEATGGAELEAETDVDAVAFYHKCGFAVARFVDPRWPEVERWRCLLPARAEASAR